jgi:hypothetical protein
VIPVVGPWMTFPYTGSGGRAVSSVLGIAQATGLLMSIVGIARYNADDAANVGDEPVREQRERQWRSNGRISLGVLPTRDGAFGLVSGRF